MKRVKIGLMFSLAIAGSTAFADRSTTIPEVGEAFTFYAWGDNNQYGYSGTIVSTSGMYIQVNYDKKTKKFFSNSLEGTIQVQITNVTCPPYGHRKCLKELESAQGNTELGVPDVGRVITIDANVPYQRTSNSSYSSSDYSNFTDKPLGKKWAKISKIVWHQL
jgi:hypothetical protein